MCVCVYICVVYFSAGGFGSFVETMMGRVNRKISQIVNKWLWYIGRAGRVLETIN